MSEPRLSVIIPAHNAAVYLQQTLAGVQSSSYRDFECIVVDDHSTDDTGDLARAAGAAVVTNAGARGPGAARNAGALKARGEILLFIDADCVPHADTLSLIANSFDQRAEIAAVFGSYDDEPGDRSLVSSFKNLMHHYVHHHGNPEASTFWTGCGAIRAEVFRELGGFLPTSLSCLEDIEYGHRLDDTGHRVWLRPEIQVKHLKRWTLPGLIRTDVLVRGIPWTVMMLRRGHADNDLNFTWHHKASGVLACMQTPLGVAAILAALTGASGVAAFCVGLMIFGLLGIILLNRDFYRFLSRKRGAPFAVACFPLHLLYYHYSVVAFAAGLCLHVVTRKRTSP